MTNIALVFEPKCGGIQLYTGAKKSFGDLTPYLTYVLNHLLVNIYKHEIHRTQEGILHISKLLSREYIIHTEG
jgi:hypothetical protein